MNLVDRAKNILLKPKQEWAVIAAEPHTVQDLYTGYVMILAAIPAVASFIGFSIIGISTFMGSYRWPITTGITHMILQYVLNLGWVYVLALIIDALAPNFGGEKNFMQALKVSAFSPTAMWLAGIFSIIPAIAILGIVGLYSLYLLYVGLPRTMKSPEQQSMPYTIVVIVLGVVVFVIGGAVAGAVTTMGAIGSAVATGQAAPITGTVNLGNGASVDLDKLRAAGQQAEAQMKAQREGGANKVVLIDPERLKAMLPDSVAGAARTDVSATTASAAGFGASNAQATYQNGGAQITLKVTDLGAAGSFAAMASAVSAHSEEHTANGYKKVSTEGGMLTTEKYDNQSRSGEYSIIVANRFSIEADGSGVDMGALKAAVAAVGPDRVASLAHG